MFIEDPASGGIKTMNQETKTCQNCHSQFRIEPDDFRFYEKIQVPPPTFCPECRHIRRLSFRNERALYKRKCDLCGQDKIFMYPADSKFTVYCRDCWLSDKWNGSQYSRDYDFSKPFFEQFEDLLKSVPRPGIIKQGNTVNSEYTNRVTDQKNGYLVFGTTASEDCFYGVWLNDSKLCADSYNTQKSEKCYGCIDCFKCYDLNFSQECNECSESSFLLNCRNCNDCFGCVNLRSKSYNIFNRQYSKEEYQKAIGQYYVGSNVIVDGIKAKFDSFRDLFVFPWMVKHRGDNVSGSWIENSKNVFQSFNCRECEDVRNSSSILKTRDAADFTYWGNGAENIYESVNVGIQASNVKFSNETWSSVDNIEYSTNCQNSYNLFGCVGMRNASFCILNKEFSEGEDRILVEKIRKQMRGAPYKDKGGREYRYGEFFPLEISPFAYNETLSQEFFPISKERADEMGYPWREPEKKNYNVTIKSDRLPDRIDDVSDSILNEIIECPHNGKCNHQCTTAFKIIPQELEFLRNSKISLPRICHNCRHYERLSKRTPMKLWHRSCQCDGTKSKNGIYTNSIKHQHSNRPCPNEFETSYAPERPEIVYCEQCYNAEVA